jgi:hypothetical protein
MRARFSFAVLASLGISSAILAAPLSTPVVNINFDSLSVGSPVTGDLSVGNPGSPETNPYGIGGFPDTPPYNGTVTVQNTTGLTKAALMTTTQGGTGSQYLDTQFLTGVSNAVDVSFDLNVADVPGTGLPQSGGGAANGQAFVVQGFGNSTLGGVVRAFRFVVAPTTATTGSLALRNNTNGDVNSIGSYTEGDDHHVELVLDYGAQTLNAYLDNSLVASNVPFVDAGVTNGNLTDLEELFIFQNGVEGQTNSVAIDNIQVSVPEPATLGLMAIAAPMLLRRRRAAK